MYKPRKSSTKSPDLAKGEPVSFLIMGIANDSKRKTDYRSNALMVVTVNNQLQKLPSLASRVTTMWKWLAPMANTIKSMRYVFGGADMQIKRLKMSCTSQSIITFQLIWML